MMESDPMPARPPAAVLWDMDGTLIDSDAAGIAAEMDLARECGGTWSTEQGLALVGSDLAASALIIQEQMPCDLPVGTIVDRLLDGVIEHVTREVPWQPGARELLTALGEAGIPCALVTSSYRRFAEPVVAALPPCTFGAVITGDQVERGKPDPEPYLVAAGALGVDPTECVVIEDSEPGVRSGEAAGCRVVVVPAHAHPVRSPGRTFYTSLSGLSVESLFFAVDAASPQDPR